MKKTRFPDVIFIGTIFLSYILPLNPLGDALALIVYRGTPTQLKPKVIFFCESIELNGYLALDDYIDYRMQRLLLSQISSAPLSIIWPSPMSMLYWALLLKHNLHDGSGRMGFGELLVCLETLKTLQRNDFDYVLNSINKTRHGHI